METLVDIAGERLTVDCAACRRHGSYRLDGLMTRFGPEISTLDLLRALTAFWCHQREAGATVARKYESQCLAHCGFRSRSNWSRRSRPADPSRSRSGIAAGYDGRERVLANVHPSGPASGAWVTVGRDRDVAFTDVDAATRRGLVLIALGTALALLAAVLAGRFFIRRPFDRLLRAATAWQMGDLSARIGMTRGDEFGRLGGKLDAMAGTLQRREGELRDEIARGREMQDRQVMLLHELNHRVRNTLATVQALARQSSRGGEAQGERLEGRILALSKTHDLLTRDDWSGVPLCEVVEGELGPYRGGPTRIITDGPDLDLPARHVLALGMTLHELITNAAKHGALSDAAGEVRVTWRIVVGESGQRRLLVNWVESGGPVVAKPTRKGFGSRLIAASIERELDGYYTLDFDRGGLRCVIDVPLHGGYTMMSPLDVGTGAGAVRRSRPES